MATLLNTNRQYLSQIINEVFGVNFYQLINQYRIDEVKSRFFKKDHQKLSIMGVAENVGFHSKSTFYTHFKKNTGLTPSEFLKKNNL